MPLRRRRPAAAVHGPHPAEWSGAQHLPPEGGFVVVTNHYSYVDPFVFGHFLVDHGCSPRYLGKVEVFRIAGHRGWILRAPTRSPCTGSRVVRPTPTARRSPRCEAGKCVAVSPEGTLTRDPDLWPMGGKTGAARIALETACPVIPVATWGAHEASCRRTP